MASSINDENEFEDLTTELDYLKALLNSDETLTKSTTSTRSINIKFLLRKSILFTVTVPEYYPYNTNKTNSQVKLISANLDNLKYTRIKLIEDFIQSTNDSLAEVLDDQTDLFFIIKCFRKAELCLSSSEEGVVHSLELLENQTIKFPANERETEALKKSTKVKSASSNLKEETSKEPSKFKGYFYTFYLASFQIV
jgi:hypothetical protein